MFKQGDIVKRKESMWKGIEAYTLQPFDKFEVSAYFSDCKFPLVCFKESGSYQWDAAYFELVEEEKMQLKVPKFCRGDKVILTNPKANSGHGLEEGWIGYVLSPNDGSDELPVQVATEESNLVYYYFDEDELELLSANSPRKAETKPDVINSPKHYAVFESVEAIQVIASSMTQDQFYGYCFGNCLKYRLRAGAKDDVMQELAKANKYQELYTEHKHLCKGEK